MRWIIYCNQSSNPLEIPILTIFFLSSLNTDCDIDGGVDGDVDIVVLPSFNWQR